MIINSGMRTDIPAYYSEWFYNRIREGYVLTRNPYYPQQVTRYRLSPDVVDCLGFCTKNPEPMLDRLDELDAYHQFWFVTITPYGKEIEPNVPEKERVMEAFRRLSGRVGINSVSWRYDPIFLSDRYDMAFHIKSFEDMASKLSGATDSCVISFIDLYEKTKKNFPGVSEVKRAEREELAKSFVSTGKKYGIKIRTCSEGTELERFGVDVSGCMTKEILERAVGSGLHVPKREKSPRASCGCLLGHDIGMYNTCGHGCIYCYANFNNAIVRKNMADHDPKSPYLIGRGREEDVIRDARQEPFTDGQLSMFSLFLHPDIDRV